MNKNTTVKCPNCKEVFKVDDSVYTDIVKQVRDQEFQEELNNRLRSAEKEKQAAIKKLTGKPEITRFKGLGEISPNEFKHFIRKR